MMASLMKIIATLPTYNEADNIELLMAEILAIGPDYEILVVDDNSPDGTYKIVGDAAAQNSRIHIIHRTNERGRGTAGLAAFRWARDNGADAVIEMDADFSHAPRFIPSLVQPVREEQADIVIGSRLVEGGGEQGRPPSRKIITLMANTYIRLMLGLPVRDATSGFRVFSRRALTTIPWEKMTARGPEIVQEVLWEARRANLTMTERPILFEERRAGTSTFNRSIMMKSLLYMLKLRLGIR
jgi:dolichol-phosphate mannosyltransferase